MPPARRERPKGEYGEQLQDIHLHHLFDARIGREHPLIAVFKNDISRLIKALEDTNNVATIIGDNLHHLVHIVLHHGSHISLRVTEPGYRGKQVDWTVNASDHSMRSRDTTPRNHTDHRFRIYEQKSMTDSFISVGTYRLS